MTKIQYRRLLLVLSIPLLAIGWWLAESELVFEHHHTTNCIEVIERFTCTSRFVSKQEKDDHHLWRAKGVYLRGARLMNASNEEIVTLGLKETTKYIFTDLEDTANTRKMFGESTKKFLNLGAMANPRNSGASLYHLYPMTTLSNGVRGIHDVWKLTNVRSVGQWDQPFRFVSAGTNAKYLEAWQRVKAENSKFTTQSRMGYAVSVIIPIIVFLVLSLFVFVSRKLIIFIIHGKRPNSSLNNQVKT